MVAAVVAYQGHPSSFVQMQSFEEFWYRGRRLLLRKYLYGPLHHVRERVSWLLVRIVDSCFGCDSHWRFSLISIFLFDLARVVGLLFRGTGVG